jgi:NhaP-type Na+/H+ or K+/H+ antiporter
VGAIPLFTLSLWWLIRNLRQKKPVVLPVLCTGFFFLSAYLYLIIVGRNIPWWVYGLIAVLVAYGVYATWQKIKKGATQHADA